LTRHGQNWQFLRVEPLEAPSAGYVTGYLAKYRPLTDEEVAVPATQDLAEQTIENRVSAKSRFFLHIASGLIAYHPVGSLITRDQFRRRFSEVFETSKGGFFVSAEIQSIQEEETLQEAIKALSVVRSVRIYLHPSNPRLRDVWRRTDERLRELHAADYQEHFHSDSSGDGLRIVHDADINSKVAMAQDGYGRVTVTGLKDGEELSVSTDDNPTNALGPADDAAPEQVLEILEKLFLRILARFEQ